MFAPTIAALRARGVLSPIDEHFAATLGRVAHESDERVLLAAALVSRYLGNGHVCVDLCRVARESLPDETGAAIDADWPEGSSWLDALRASVLVAEEECAAPLLRPLILDGRGRLYLHRHWHHQRRLADGIRNRVVHSISALAAERRRSKISEKTARAEPDWQEIAALVAAASEFCVISGGPGTGKTYSVVKILSRLIADALTAGKRAPRIQLLAPTGKAAARLQQSIRENRDAQVSDLFVRAAIPDEASTIHRCLSPRVGTGKRFRYDADNPLLVDVVVVDETSMVDLSLMARLVDALPDHARLILLGDKDQLASVEAGAVLGDICNTGGRRAHSRAFARHVVEVTGQAIPVAADAPDEPGIWDCVVHLTKSHRHSENSAVAALAAAINVGDVERALQILAQVEHGVRLIEVSGASLLEALLPIAVDGFRPYLSESVPEAQLRALDGFRLLCAHRHGPGGAATLNLEIETELRRRSFIEGTNESWYIKRPLLVTRNDYQLDLYNGDVGVIGSTEAEPRAFFAAPGRGCRSFSLSRLPPNETVYAMTIHKSQGSELEHAAIVLPDELSPVLSRELLYTAVSRAKQTVTLFASREIVRQAISRRVERASGLRDLLWP